MNLVRVEENRAIESGGKDAVARVARRAGFGSETAGAGFIDGDGVARGLELRVLEGVDDVGGCGRRNLSCERDGSKGEEQREWGRTKHG